MAAGHRSHGIFRRLVIWLNSSPRHKLYSVLVRIFRAANNLDCDIIRSAQFEAADPNLEFSIAARGNEKFVIINSDRAISKSLYVKGSFDFDKVEKAISIISTINKDFRLGTLIDIGANLGTVCIPAVKRGLATKAVAIEPEPLNYRLLVANIFLNDLADKIVSYNLALGSQNGQVLELELSANHSGDHRIRVKKETNGKPLREALLVKSTTFDTIISTTDKNSCLVWMDTQGYEGIILQGALNAIDAQVPIVIEFWPHGMKKMDSYIALKNAIMRYKGYYDLGEESTRQVATSEPAIDGLFQRLVEQDTWTDILLV